MPRTKAATKPKSASKPASKPVSKSNPKPTPAHPTWIDMIRECIVNNPDDARQGVSRHQIKKYVEEQYKLEIGAAQIAQLSRALTTGTDKDIFVLPKGPSGRVKLSPKAKAAYNAKLKEDESAAKPTSKPAPKPTSKPTSKPAPSPKQWRSPSLNPQKSHPKLS
ncbi:hypothetical protein BD779DRAFT_858328 [Infundibulicybe gibba]|nr:hypothetical protein BD779DRAFT_858328 [Infundibulicybe gibba]